MLHEQLNRINTTDKVTKISDNLISNKVCEMFDTVIIINWEFLSNSICFLLKIFVVAFGYRRFQIVKMSFDVSRFEFL